LLQAPAPWQKSDLFAPRYRLLTLNAYTWQDAGYRGVATDHAMRGWMVKGPFAAGRKK